MCEHANTIRIFYGLFTPPARANMGRTPGSRLAVVGHLQKVVKPWEDWDEIDGFMIIASAFPRSRRGKQFMRPFLSLRKKKKKKRRHHPAKPKQPINHQKAKLPPRPPSPPSPPVPRVRLLLRQPPPPPAPPPAPEPAPIPARKHKKGEPSERSKAISNCARYMRFEMICDLAGVPSVHRHIAPPRPPPPIRRKKPPPPPPPRAPEPNLLAMGEVDLICWETMPPPTP